MGESLLTGGRIEAVRGTLEADDGDQVARVVEDGSAEGGEVLLAFALGLAIPLLLDDGDGALQSGGVGDGARGVGDEVVGDLGFRAAAEREHDLADRGRVRHARSSDKGRGADAAPTRHVIDRDRLTGRGQRERGRLTGVALEPFEERTRDCADIKACEHVGAQLKQAHTEAIPTRLGHALDEVVCGEGPEQARGGRGGDAECTGDGVHALRLV